MPRRPLTGRVQTQQAGSRELIGQVLRTPPIGGRVAQAGMLAVTTTVKMVVQVKAAGFWPKPYMDPTVRSTMHCIGGSKLHPSRIPNISLLSITAQK
jgi:hypothetical protein